MSGLKKTKSPGDHIREELDSRGWTQADLAKVLDRPLPTINRILNGKHAVLPEMAIALSMAFGNDAQEWMDRESAYRLSLAESGAEEVRKRARLYEIAPVKDMEKRQWIKSTKNYDSLEAELKKFFGVPTFDQEPQLVADMRKSKSSLSGMTSSQRAWCFRSRQLAETLITNVYDTSNNNSLLRKLRRLAAYRNEATNVSDLLAEFGIRFVVVEPLPGSKIDGAAFWIDENKPVVAMSLRYDRHDYFWFTLMHEIMHILHGDAFSIDDDLGREEDNAITMLKEDQERLADEAAASALVPTPELESFIRRVGPLYSQERIIQFAHRIKMHPGVIVGQLQNRGEIGWRALRSTLVKIRDIVTKTSLTDGWGNIIGCDLD